MQQHKHNSNQDTQHAHNIQIGHIYEHYKGKQYKVLAVARNTDDLNYVYVVYECLYKNPVSQIWVRPLDQFIEIVMIEGSPTPRFRYIGQK